MIFDKQMAVVASRFNLIKVSRFNLIERSYSRQHYKYVNKINKCQNNTISKQFNLRYLHTEIKRLIDVKANNTNSFSLSYIYHKTFHFQEHQRFRFQLTRDGGLKKVTRWDYENQDVTKVLADLRSSFLETSAQPSNFRYSIFLHFMYGS